MFDIGIDSDDEAEVLTWGDVRDESGKVQIFLVMCHVHEYLARLVVSKPLEELMELDTLDPASASTESPPQAGQMAGYTHGVPVGTLA